MFWGYKVLDELKTAREKAQRQGEFINDSWTPSGPVHIGSLRSPVIHDATFQLLKKESVPVTFQIGSDDFDPMDGIPAGLDKDKYLPHMGKPMFNVPSEEEGKSFAQYFTDKYRTIITDLNIQCDFYNTSDLYKNGTFDTYIEKALGDAEKIKQIYITVSGSARSDNWLPFQPICEKCGKLGTTEAIAFDGKEVKYVCRPALVTWAQGCGYEGSVSPFGGTGKMPWRVEWAAKWAHFGVTLEAAGKDHASKGSSFDVSTEICHQLFESPSPFKLGHEFLTVEGKKMASSKGLGLFSDEVLHLFSPELVKFIMLRTPPPQAIEFDLRNPNVVLKYFDEFDKFRLEKEDPEMQLIADLSAGPDRDYLAPRFANFVQWVQMPNIDPRNESAKLKGSDLTEREIAAVDNRAAYARYWLEHYAPEDQKFAVKKELPEQFAELTEKQAELLAQIASNLNKDNAEEFQNEIYQMGKTLELSSQETFQAIYKALIGKNAGPKAAWLILSLDKDFVAKRFRGEG